LKLRIKEHKETFKAFSKILQFAVFALVSWKQIHTQLVQG